MDATKKDYLRTQLKFSDAEIAEIEATATATEKAADDARTTYKADDAPDLPDLVINGITYKAFPPKKDDAPPVEETVVEEDAIEDMPIEEDVPDDPNAMTLSGGDLAAIQGMIGDAMAQIMGGLDLEKKVASHVQGFLTPLAQAQTTKDAALTEATEQIASLQQQLKELTGDQPASGYRASQAKDNVLTDATMLAAAKQALDPNAGDPWADIKIGLGLISQ